jgi:inorganic pyrophosphatase/exopolyphosphatase
MKTYVIGISNQTQIAVVSAMALAEFLSPYSFIFPPEQQRPLSAIQLNNETAFLLKKFGLTAPQLIKA